MGTNSFRAFFALCLLSLTSANIFVDEECLNYTVYPVQYELNIYPHVNAEDSYYDCNITITVIANVPNVNVIDLDAIGLELKGSSIKVLEGNRDIIDKTRRFEYNDCKLHIYLNESLKVYLNDRQSYYIKISFRRNVKEDSSGVFLVKYYDERSEDFNYLFTTRLSPNKAKYFFPCFDDPRFEAVFKFKVYIKKQITDLRYMNTSLVIAQEQSREGVEGDYIIVDYMPSPQVGLYQVGFHYSQFASIRAQSQNTNDTFILWAPIDELNDFRFIHNYGITIMNLIHDYSKINRSLVQGPINLVAVPSVINGYEIGSWNLLTNGAHKIVNIAQFTSIKQIESMTFDLTQQLCRIWLSNPGEVERTKWKEEWFKEGMATYLAYYFLTQYNHGILTQHRSPLAGYGLQMKHKAMAVDWNRNTPALETFNTSLAIQIPNKYNELVTMKTGAILWMLENWVETEKFHGALVKYINSRRGKYPQGGEISLQDFTMTLDSNTIECLHQFFNGSTASRILGSWFKRRGYPVINVQVLRDRTPNAVQLKQRQFSFIHEDREETDYLIPISYVVQNNQNCYNCYRPRFTIGAQTYTFGENLNDGWIILNRQGSGYYRVNYDKDSWRLIAKTLKEDMLTIDELNRAQIVNDALALYVAGDLDFDLAMEILDYLDKERSPIVWESVLVAYEFLTIEGAACNMTRHLYWEWEDFMIRKVSPIYTHLVKSKDSQLTTRLFRSNVVKLACSLNYESCHTHVRRMYVEDRRGKHNLFPDCRAAYFYVLANETFSSTYSRKLNAIEQGDKWVADKRTDEMKKLFSKMPMGEPRPMPIVMSTTEVSTLAVTEKLQKDGGSSVKYSLTILFIALFITTFTC